MTPRQDSKSCSPPKRDFPYHFGSSSSKKFDNKRSSMEREEEYRREHIASTSKNNSSNERMSNKVHQHDSNAGVISGSDNTKREERRDYERYYGNQRSFMQREHYGWRQAWTSKNRPTVDHSRRPVHGHGYDERRYLGSASKNRPHVDHRRRIFHKYDDYKKRRCLDSTFKNSRYAGKRSRSFDRHDYYAGEKRHDRRLENTAYEREKMRIDERHSGKKRSFGEMEENKRRHLASTSRTRSNAHQCDSNAWVRSCGKPCAEMLTKTASSAISEDGYNEWSEKKIGGRDCGNKPSDRQMEEEFGRGYMASTSKNKPCIGTIRSNVHHYDSNAGVGNCAKPYTGMLNKTASAISKKDYNGKKETDITEIVYDNKGSLVQRKEYNDGYEASTSKSKPDIGSGRRDVHQYKNCVKPCTGVLIKTANSATSKDDYNEWAEKKIGEKLAQRKEYNGGHEASTSKNKPDFGSERGNAHRYHSEAGAKNCVKACNGMLSNTANSATSKDDYYERAEKKIGERSAACKEYNGGHEASTSKNKPSADKLRSVPQHGNNAGGKLHNKRLKNIVITKHDNKDSAKMEIDDRLKEFRRIRETISSQGGGSHRSDLKALKQFERKFPAAEKKIGEVSGVEVGKRFQYRAELIVAGLHSDRQRGIDYMSTYRSLLATCVVANEEYGDEMHDPNVLTYRGEGGSFDVNKGGHPKNQTLTRRNLALIKSKVYKNDVRVVWKIKGGTKSNRHYIYAGLYKVIESKDTGPPGNIFEFKLKRNDGQPDVSLH